MPDQDPRQATASSQAREVRPAPEPPGTRPAGKPARRSWWWRALWILILLAAAVELGLWFAGRQSGAPAAATRAQTAAASIQVGVATVTTGDVPVILDELGTVTPLATDTVKSQVSGHITDIKFQEGQIVQKGDLLIVIDVRPFTIALESAQATLAHDQALLANARVDLARFQKLMQQDSVAAQTLDTQRFLVTQDEATVQLDQAAVDNAKLNLDYCHITAPITGRIGLRQVDLGNFVTAGSDALVVIAQIQPITVVFALPEDNLPAVMKQLQAGAVLPATAYDRSMTTKIATGQLLTLDNQIDTTTGTVKLKAEFDNKDQGLFPNQFVNIRLLVSTLTGVPVVPRAAVLNGAPGDYVYLVQPGDTVAIRPVKLGPADGERVSIESGLVAGDRVVVDGTDRLRDGAKINIAGKTKPAGGTQGKSKKAAANP
jgi:multidrug efflux system membrane fusion protein